MYQALRRTDLMRLLSERGYRPASENGTWLAYSNDEMRHILATCIPGDAVPPPQGDRDPITPKQQAALQAYVSRTPAERRPHALRSLSSDTIPHLTKGQASQLVSTIKGAPKPAPQPEPTQPETDDAAAARALREALEALGIGTKAGGPDPATAADLAALAEAVSDLRSRVEAAEAGARPIVHIHVPSLPAPKVLPDVHHPVLPRVIALLARGANILLVGPAGTGKSTIAQQAAEALDLSYHAMSVSIGTRQSDLWGYQDANGTYRESPLYRAYSEGGLFLLDELDAGHPGILAGLNQALSNGHANFPPGMVTRHPNTRVVCTANTYGRGNDTQYLGRNALDAATLDRFVTLRVDYDTTLEDQLAAATGEVLGLTTAQVTGWISQVRDWRAKAERANLKVVIGTRTLLDGLKCIAIGMTHTEAFDAKGASALKAPEREALGLDR